MHFRILKMIANFLTALEYIKFVFSRGSAPPRPCCGSLVHSPRSRSWFKFKGPSSKGRQGVREKRERKMREGNGEGNGRGG